MPESITSSFADSIALIIKEEKKIYDIIKPPEHIITEIKNKVKEFNENTQEGVKYEASYDIPDMYFQAGSICNSSITIELNYTKKYSYYLNHPIELNIKVNGCLNGQIFAQVSYPLNSFDAFKHIEHHILFVANKIILVLGKKKLD